MLKNKYIYIEKILNVVLFYIDINDLYWPIYLKINISIKYLKININLFILEKDIKWFI